MADPPPKLRSAAINTDERTGRKGKEGKKERIVKRKGEKKGVRPSGKGHKHWPNRRKPAADPEEMFGGEMIGPAHLVGETAKLASIRLTNLQIQFSGRTYFRTDNPKQNQCSTHNSLVPLQPSMPSIIHHFCNILSVFPSQQIFSCATNDCTKLCLILGTNVCLK